MEIKNSENKKVDKLQKIFLDENVRITSEIRKKAGKNKKITFVSGNFNIVHPGHLRLLNFAAECGDYLVVAINSDSNGVTLLPEHLRLESIQSISVVNYAFILHTSPEDFIKQLKPDTVVKGKEFEHKANAELKVVDSYGGKLLFSSGEVRFSSYDLLQKDLNESNLSSIKKQADYPNRHEFSMRDLMDIVYKFSKLNVVVIGDLIIDEYVICDPLGMSQEDPTIVVTPIKRNLFIGGAGVVASHASGLGGKVKYFTVAGKDSVSDMASDMLKKYGVQHSFLYDDSRPTTLKQRFRANGKTLLRVSVLKQHDISQALTEKIYNNLIRALKSADLLIFSDFSYGCLPQNLVDDVRDYCKKHSIYMAADSQASSQVGDISRFKGVDLITPTEREARLAIRDFTSGLVIVSEKLQEVTGCKNMAITLGSEGVLIYAPAKNKDSYMTDQLPAFNTAPKDVAGAGDALLTCSSMALALGATCWESIYLGSIAAACQVSRVGNRPLSPKEILTELSL